MKINELRIYKSRLEARASMRELHLLNRPEACGVQLANNTLVIESLAGVYSVMFVPEGEEMQKFRGSAPHLVYLAKDLIHYDDLYEYFITRCAVVGR